MSCLVLFGRIALMIITTNGHHSIKLQSGDTVLSVNPISKNSKLKSTRFGADVVLVSINHPDFNGFAEMSFADRFAFVINAPGEYEVKGMTIKGFMSKSNYDDGEYLNTIYSVNMDGIHVCCLGALSEDKVSVEAMEAMNDIDILFIPVSEGTLNPSDAYKISVSLEAKLIIPFGDDAMIKSFIKEAGVDKPETVDKITIKKKDLDQKQGEVILLKA